MKELISIQHLEAFMKKAFIVSGVPSKDAEVVTENLMKAELKGIVSHGLSRFPVYLKRIRQGLVNPKPNISVSQVLPGVLTVDGDNGLGSVVTFHAMNKAMGIANQIGICAIGIKKSNHFGISTYYCEIAADNGFASIILTNSPPATPPWGGKEPYFGTNPMAFGMPRPQKPHIIVDLATSVVARGKIIKAAQLGESIPEGWALDKEGYPTTDAKAALEGALLPIAGPKGYALSLAVEHLAGVFTGAGYGREVAWQYGNSEEPANVGHFIVLIKADAFISGKEYAERVEKFVSEIKDNVTAPGFTSIKLPGEREWESEQLGIKEGITVEPNLISSFEEIGRELGINWDQY
jgi:LDH2 family malate/lactate/ureidoglycolate dehydrogenase